MTYEEMLLNPIRQPLYKIIFCDENENEIDEIIRHEIDGNLMTELKNGIRRTCNFTLENEDGVFLPSTDGLVSINNRVKIYSGQIVNDQPEYIQQGVFILGNPRATGSSTSENSMFFELHDKFALLDGTKNGYLITDYLIPRGTPIEDAVLQLIQDTGLPNIPVLVYPTSEVTPYSLPMASGSTYADILYKLADFLSWEVFFDVYGVLRFQPPTDQMVSDYVWEFTTEQNSLISSVRNFDWTNLRNYIVVIGDNINGSLVRAVASDQNIFSDTYVGKIGNITASPIKDSLIYTLPLAQDRADYELLKAIQKQESVDITHIPIDIIKEGDIVLLTNNKLGVNRERYLIMKTNLPLSIKGEQTSNLWNVRDVV